MLPPLLQEARVGTMTDGDRARALIEQIQLDVSEAKDNLMLAKIAQSHHANKKRADEIAFNVGDKVMLSMKHRRKEYAKKGEKRSAKFFPHFDGPYTVIKKHPEMSNYTLDMPDTLGAFPTFHSSLLKRFIANDATLFPERELNPPGPIVTPDGLTEYFVEEIVDARRRGKGWQFLVRWTGFGREHDEWLSARLLDDCEALDRWYEKGGDGPAGERQAFSPKRVF
jgi:hypothetical protein